MKELDLFNNDQNSDKVKVRYWIWGGYAIPITLSILSALGTWSQVNGFRGLQEDVVRTVKVAEDIGNLGIQIQVSSRETRGYLLDPNQDAKNTFEESVQQINKTFDLLDPIVKDEEQRQNLQDLRDAFNELLQINQNLVRTAATNRELAITEWKKEGGRKAAEKVTNALDKFAERQSQITESNNAKMTEKIDALINLVLSVSLISALVAIGLGVWIINRITGQINGMVGVLAASTTEIAATVEEQERIASQQAASVNQTTTTMDELNASSRQSAEQAETAANAAQQVLQLAQAGNQSVSETLQGMDQVRQKVETIAQKITHLSDKTTEIGSISQLVADLANQTNMLALNAAVEAVRAGEHGKGFSVVAAEIRKLADQSRQSTDKINMLVSEIQNSINSTVSATDDGTRSMDSSVEVAQKTAHAFIGVTDAMNNVVLNNQQISLNLQQQTIAIQQVVDAMNNINRGAQESANGIGQTRLGTQRLNEVSNSLKNMI